MSSPVDTTFTSGTTITSDWLNGVNDHVNSIETYTHNASKISFTQAGVGAVATDVQSKLRDSVSVKDFGAVGDGVADDYAEIQAAIDAINASGGGVIVFPYGIYGVGTQLRFKSNVTLDLRSGATIRRMFNTSALGAGLFGAPSGATNVAILGGTLDGNGDVYDTAFDMVYGVGFDGLTIEGTRFLDVVDYHCIDVANSQNVRIRDCKFLGFYNKVGTRDSSEAIQVDPDIANGGNENKNILVTGCYFGDNPDQPSANFAAWPCGVGNHAAVTSKYHRRITVTDNVFDGCTWAGINLLNMNDVVVSGNQFAGCTRGVRFRLYEPGTNAQGCTGVTIDGNVFDTGTDAPVEFASPTSAADVGTGRHKDIVISNNIAVDVSGGNFVDMCFASRATISGNVVKNATTHAVALRFSDTVNISGNSFYQPNQSGVWIHETVETSLAGTGLTKKINITGNLLDSCGYRGVHLNCAAKMVTISNNQIIDPDTAASAREGIRVDSSPDRVDVIGNTVSFSGSVTSTYGIAIASGTNIAVKGNRSVGITQPYQLSGTATTLADVESVGTPLSVYSAVVGSICRRTDGGASTSIYVKESGTGSTGWVAK